MHAKMIRGKFGPYFYTVIRVKDIIKTFYLGKDEKIAREKEKHLKSKFGVKLQHRTKLKNIRDNYRLDSEFRKKCLEQQKNYKKNRYRSDAEYRERTLDYQFNYRMKQKNMPWMSFPSENLPPGEYEDYMLTHENMGRIVIVIRGPNNQEGGIPG